MKKLTPTEKQERLHRRQFEKDARNYGLDFSRHPDFSEQYATHPTELAFTFYNIGRLRK
jgi:hypothetical protein